MGYRRMNINDLKSIYLRWKADQFFSFHKKRYSMPTEFKGRSLYCKRTGIVLKVFDGNYLLLRKYIINSLRLQTLKGDFPESYEAMIKGGYPQYLIQYAETFGSTVRKLIEECLKPHAFIKARCARGILSVIEKYKDDVFLHKVCQNALNKKIFYPKTIKALLDLEKTQLSLKNIIPRSKSGDAMIRDIKEYLN